MTTVSQHREEKNLQDAREDFHNHCRIKLINERIQFRVDQINREKQSISECLSANWFGMARTKINRIEELQKEIIQLHRSKQS